MYEDQEWANCFCRTQVGRRDASMMESGSGCIFVKQEVGLPPLLTHLTILGLSLGFSGDLDLSIVKDLLVFLLFLATTSSELPPSSGDI